MTNSRLSIEVQVTVEDTITAVNDSLALNVQLELTHRYASIRNLFSGIYAYVEGQTPAVDVFLVDEDNLNAAKNNEPFTAVYAALGVSTLDELIFPPSDETWNLLVISHSAPFSDQLLDLSVAAEGDPWVPPDDDTSDDDDDTGPPPADDDDDNNDDDGCGC